jgi:hypothetical protein
MDSKDLDTVNIIVREELPANDNYGAPLELNTGLSPDKIAFSASNTISAYSRSFGNLFPNRDWCLSTSILM